MHPHAIAPSFPIIEFEFDFAHVESKQLQLLFLNKPCFPYDAMLNELCFILCIEGGILSQFLEPNCFDIIVRNICKF